MPTKTYPTLGPELCGELARIEFGVGRNKNKTTKGLDDEITKSLFGTSYIVCSEIWNLLQKHQSEKIAGSHPRHLFWAILFLKTYCTEAILRRVVGGVDNKTLRKWTWLFVEAIAALKPEVIIFSQRFKDWTGLPCLISVDGVDCPIKEPYPFDRHIFSHKLNGPGLKYEVGVSIQTGLIVWVNGPFKAGKGDAAIFEEDGLLDSLALDECVEVDGGYSGNDVYKNPSIAENRQQRKQKGGVRARQENVNQRLKIYDVLNQVFRHPLDEEYTKHGLCFEAVAVITQLKFDLEGPLYDVAYDVDYY